MSDWAYRIARHAVRTRGAIQDENELEALLDTIREPPAQVVVELGTQVGGTFYALSAAAAPDALLVSIDISPLTSAPFATLAELTSYCLPTQEVYAIYGDSNKPETLAALEEYLADEPIDVLFIDADHHYEAVKRDHEMYSPLVRSGGWVCLHDIHRSPRHQAGCEVGQYWKEITRERGIVNQLNMREFITAPAFGIGAYQKP